MKTVDRQTTRMNGGSKVSLGGPEGILSDRGFGGLDIGDLSKGGEKLADRVSGRGRSNVEDKEVWGGPPGRGALFWLAVSPSHL